MPSSGKINPPRLGKALSAGYRKMQWFRSLRVKMLTNMVGRFYAQVKEFEDGELKASPINLLNTAINTLVPNLISKNPQVKFRSDVLEYRNYAEILGLATSKSLVNIKFKDELRKIVTDSLIAAGFSKSGLMAGVNILPIDGTDVDLGAPYTRRVDPDDMVLDPNARSWEEQSFIGNRYEIDEFSLERANLDPDILKSLTSRLDSMSNKGAANLAGRARADNALIKRFDVVDVYVPSENLIYTVPWRPGLEVDRFINVVEWAGRDEGPYHMLGYQFIPDNILPVPPASIWFDLHVMANKIARKIARQSDRLKRVLVYDGDSIDDAQNVVDAVDGEAIKVNNVDGIKELNFGETADQAFVTLDWIKSQFSEQSGNVNQLAGIKSEAPTLGQSQILEANSSVRLSDLQDQVTDFIVEVAKDHAFYLHTDPFFEDLPLVRRNRGVDEQVFFTPEERQGDFLEYFAEIVPFSTVKQDPSLRVRRMLEFATTAVPAAAQAAQILGPAFRLDEYLSTIANEIGLEDIDSWFDFQEFKDIFMTKFLADMEGQGNAASFLEKNPLKVGQPNPGQTGPTGGVSPAQETNSANQDFSAQFQNGPNGIL